VCQTLSTTTSISYKLFKLLSSYLFLSLYSFNLTREQGTFALPSFSILDTVLGDTCPRTSFCQPHKYRSTDGSCNNINHELWGRASTALQRILPPKYGDGKYLDSILNKTFYVLKSVEKYLFFNHIYRYCTYIILIII